MIEADTSLFQNMLVQLIICFDNETVLHQKQLFEVLHKNCFY